ncbi:MAG TPA: hypothetical protein VNN22_12445 [Verrucomicrobiae bacterium]|nr:hypothetical protein [Verrucomicrobiae bacterium]
MNKKASFVKGVLIFGFILGLQLDTHAAIYFCKTSADGIDDVHTLRGAIAAAASNRAKSDTIILVRDSYQVTAQSFLGDELAIAVGNLTIVGQGRSRVTISAAGLTHIFHVLPGAQLTLKNLTLVGGGDTLVPLPPLVPAPMLKNLTLVGGGGFYYSGVSSGAILNEGTLKLVNCDIQGNRAANGAGIYNSGNLTMHNSVVANNSCSSQFGLVGTGGSGGGIYNAGILTADNCVISNNFSGAGATFLWVNPGSAGGNGGGIYNVGTMILNNCDVVDNFAGNGGVGMIGGAFGHDGGAGGSGGGIYNAGSLTLKRCLIGGNSCGNGGAGSDSYGVVSVDVGGDGGNGGAGGCGGGIFNADGSSVTSFNCLIGLNEFGIGGNGGAGFPAGGGGWPRGTGNNTAGANGNAGTDGLGPDLFGDFTSTGNNLVGEGDYSTGFTNGVRHDIVGTITAPANPLLYKFKK